MDAKKIAMEVFGITANFPSYYSGRGATTDDINGEMLCKIYHLVGEHHGNNAQKSFISMISSINILSATAFLNSFYKLEKHEWDAEDESYEVVQSGVDVGRETKGELAGTDASLISRVLGHNQRDDTIKIKQDFFTLIGMN